MRIQALTYPGVGGIVCGSRYYVRGYKRERSGDAGADVRDYKG